MRRICWVIAGVVLAFSFAGCSETAPEGGTVDYKGSNSAAIDALRKQMSDNMTNKDTRKKPVADSRPAAGSKSGETKPTSDTKSSEKKD